MKLLTFYSEFKSDLFQNTPLRNWNSNFFLWVQIWPIPEHPHLQKLKLITFYSEFKSDLFQNTPLPPETETLKLFSLSSNLTYSRTPPRNWNSNFLLWVQIWPIPEHPPEIETLTFFSEFKSDVFQNTLPEIETLTFYSEFRSDLFENTPLPQKLKL